MLSKMYSLLLFRTSTKVEFDPVEAIWSSQGDPILLNEDGVKQFCRGEYTISLRFPFLISLAKTREGHFVDVVTFPHLPEMVKVGSLIVALLTLPCIKNVLVVRRSGLYSMNGNFHFTSCP